MKFAATAGAEFRIAVILKPTLRAFNFATRQRGATIATEKRSNFVTMTAIGAEMPAFFIRFATRAMQIITDYSVGGEGWAGGLIGINMNGRVTKCTVEGSIYVRRNSSTVGGLAGYTYGGYFYDNVVTSGQLQAVQGGSGAWIVCGGGVGQEKSDHVASENNNTLSAERIVNSVNWIFSTKHTDALWYGYRSNSSNWNFADYYGNVG